MNDFDFLRENQKQRLAILTSPGAKVMPHQLAVELGIGYSQALAILSVAEDAGQCAISLLIYHYCEPDLAVAATAFGDGFPPLPWKCPNCEQEVEDYTELSFDFYAVFATDAF